MPTHWLHIHKAPKAIINTLERIKREFFWNDGRNTGQGQKKLHWASWNKIVMPKDMGGLGLVDLEKKNLALLTKWWWHLNKDKTSLWSQVIRGKYGRQLDPLLSYS